MSMIYLCQNDQLHFTGGETEALRQVDLIQEIRDGRKGNYLWANRRYLQHEARDLCPNNDHLYQALCT